MRINFNLKIKSKYIKTKIIVGLLFFIFVTGCEKKDNLKLTEENANAIVHSELGLNNYIIPPGGDDGKKKDEFGCVVENGEPPMTKCEESTRNTCSKLHTCQSVLGMRQSGMYTEEELKQSEEIGTMFNEIYHADN